VYCVEDVDNPWVTDHFKSLHVDTRSTKLALEHCDDARSQERYVVIKATGGAYLQQITDATMPGLEQVTYQPLEMTDEKVGTNALRFVPYYMCANRGGRGQMRVGLKKFHRTAKDE
jgi:hypothetical protein